MLEPARKNERQRIMRQRRLGHYHQPEGDIAAMLGFAQSQLKTSERLARDNQSEYKKVVKELADKLCEKYPEISTYKGVFNGKPHLKGTRFTVADVLSAICIENSIENIAKEYENRYTEKQLKAAIRYARDFLLSANSLP